MSSRNDKQKDAPSLGIPIIRATLLFLLILAVIILLAFGTRTLVPAPVPETPVSVGALPVDTGALLLGEKITNPLDPALAFPGVVNRLSVDQIQRSIHDGDKGLVFDISDAGTLLDGRRIQPAKMNGMLYIGPYPYQPQDTKYRYKRYLEPAEIKDGMALIPVEAFLNRYRNTEGWTNNGTLSLRVVLVYDNKPIGGYDTFIGFVKDETGYHKVPWLTEGPMVNRIDSRRAGEATISFASGSPVPATLLLSDGRVFDSPAQLSHEILIRNLSPQTEYMYRIRMSNITTPVFRFKTAPPLNDNTIVFAAAGDSRQGEGGFLNNFMGLNYGTLDMISASAYENGCEFFLIAGDLVDGYTMSPEDYASQFNAFKQCMSGFWNERPVCTMMGNHEFIYDEYAIPAEKDGKPSTAFVQVDRMPYDTGSSESIFADAFSNPTDAPLPSDPRRPTYNESVYTVQYGQVRIISLNNDYWNTVENDWRNPETKKYGGAPYGYFMEDQLAWTERELVNAENDPTVKYVFVVCHCGLFPTFADAPMWRYGNDNTRAYTYVNGSVVPEPQGLVSERNRLALAIGNCSKVAAVINSHEHIYSRTLMTDQVPAGIPAVDDKNGDGMITADEPKSPLPFRYPTWYIVTGCAGGPSYAPVDPSPWTQYWKSQPNPSWGFAFSLQEHYLIIKTDGDSVSYRAVSLYGETIDKVDDLMAVKHGQRQAPAHS